MISIINAGIKTMLGDGSAGNPYQIRHAKQLYDLAVCVNAGNDCAGKYYMQTADIDLSGYSSGAGWTPIASASGTPFAGVYDGNGLGIYNLTATGLRVALFGYLTGTLKNIAIESGSLTGTTDLSLIAGICCSMIVNTNAEITGCVNKANITGASTGSNLAYIGGICGIIASNGKIENCANFGAITQNSTSSGTRLAGGIVGATTDANRSVSKCFNSGAVTGNGTKNAISGATATLSNCYFDNQTSSAGQTGATGRTTANCQGTDALTNVNKLNNLGTVNWFARQSYPLPIRFKK